MEDAEKFEAQFEQPNDELSIVRNWFEAHKEELRIDDSGIHFRTESQELILPFFEKEPDWSKFHSYQWPDGRQVYEVNLANKEIVLTSAFTDNLPNADPEKTVIQNILFVENRENGRYDPVIARYYPADEYSVTGFEAISYNQIGAGWSGTVDIWTYDERHFIGFNIKDGQMISTVKYDNGGEAEGAKTSHGQNYLTNDTVDCFRVPTTTTYTYTTTGYYETTVTATQHYATICSTGGSSGSGNYNTEPVYEYNSGGGGGGGTSAPSGQTYTPPIIKLPSIFNALTNPCASRLFIQSTKNNNFNFAIPAQIGNLNPAIISLFQQTTKYPYLIKNGDLGNANGETRNIDGVITVTLDNNYLKNATKLSIVRTIIHENVHAYFLHQTKTNLDFALGLENFAKQNNLNNLPNAHHELMGQYVLGMAISLWNWDKNFGETKGALDFEYYYAMAFAGMLDYKTNKPNSAFKNLAGNKTNKYLNIIVNEATNRNAKSKPC